MSDEGFNVNIIFDEKTGFIVGGNKYNCGTWIDKWGHHQRQTIKGILQHQGKIILTI